MSNVQLDSTRMNDWERGFVQTIKRLLQKGPRSTARQLEKLDQIWQRVTDNGFTPRGNA